MGLLADKIELTEADLSRVSGGIKLGDIKGESTDDKHKDWIEVLARYG
jgi:Type VI secretion system effector, Hcp